MSTLDVVVLVLLLVQSLLGLFALLRWRAANARIPWGLVGTHIGVVDAATILWIVRMFTDSLTWGWAALIVLLVGNGLGDLVLAGRWRADQALSGRWVTGWVSAAKDLTSPKRRAGAMHAVGAGVVTGTLAVACLVAV